MKKVIAIVVAVCICLTAFSSVLFFANASSGEKVIDLTKSVRIGEDTNEIKLAISHNDSGMAVEMTDYNTRFIDDNGPIMNKVLWLKGALLALKYNDDSTVFLETGKEYIINVVYSVDRTNGATFFPAIGLVYNNNTNAGNALKQDNGSYVLAAKNHTAVGRYSMSATRVAGNNMPLRLAFYGIGKITVEAVTISTVPAEELDLTKSGTVSVSSGAYSGFSAATATEPLKITSTRATDNEMFDGQNQWVNNWSNIKHWIKGGLVTLKRDDGSYFTLQSGHEYTVSVTYKFTACNTTDTKKDPKICLVYNDNTNTTADNGSIVIAGARLYSYGNNLTDYFNQVRTFSSKTISGDGKNGYPLRLAFSGLGSFEVYSVSVSEKDSSCVVNYVDDGISIAEYALKGRKLKTPTREDYTFEGWYDNQLFEGEPITSVSKDATLYAKWKLTGDKVYIDFIDNLGNGTQKIKCKIGSEITQKPEKEGYNFLGWYKYASYLGRPVKTVSADATKLYAKWESKATVEPIYVDLSQTPKFNYTNKTQEAGTKATVNENNHLEVDVHNYERQLSSTSLTEMSWFPNYVFKDSKGNYISLEKGTAYNLEVTYKLLELRGGTGTGVQVGFGVDYQADTNRCYVKGYKMTDSRDDVGKEFNYSVTYTVDSNIYPRLLFSGDGTVEITEIKIIKKVPAVKDTVIGVQDYEGYKDGAETGVVGDKKGTTVTTAYNHTASGKNSLQLQIATNMARLSGNTIISLKQNGKVSPYPVETGSAYKVTFYITSPVDMKNVVWNIGTAADTLMSDYIRYYTLETRGKTDIKAGEWKKIVAYIPEIKGSGVSNSFFDISVSSNAYDGKSVYIDDVEIMQLLDSELITYDTLGGDAITPTRAFANQPILTLKEAKRADYLFDGWYYDKEYKKEAKLGDIFPDGTSELLLYAKWITPNEKPVDYTAGSFDADIYPDKKAPFTNQMENIDSEIYFEGSSTMTRDVVWMEDAGICGNGTSETDGAIVFSNEFFSYRDDANGYNTLRLMNADGTPFTVVKGGRYTVSLDYVCASSRAVAYLVPIISEQSAYGNFGYNTAQTLKRISVQATDSDYQTYTQSFVAEKTGYVYIALTGRDDNSHAEQHCYERICIDNVKINVNNDVVKLDYKCGSDLYFTRYGVKGEKVVAPNLLVEKSGSSTAVGVYTDKELTKEFDGFFPDTDSVCYIKLESIDYNTPSDFTKPISLSFEENDLLKYFYNQSKFVTSWSRELTNEWIWVSGDKKNALTGNGYIQLNPFAHYWNEAKIALYDPSNPTKAMILSKGQKYRVSVMVRCIDPYEVPNGMYVCLEKPSERFLLQNNGSYKLEYDPKGDKNGFYRFAGDIEVSEDMAYLPTLAIRRAANDLQGLYIDDVTVEQLKNCKVSYNANGGSDVDPIEVQIHDLAFDPGVPYREGFVFDGWFTTLDFTKLWDFDNDTVESDMTLYAKWSVDKGETEKPEDIITDDGDDTDKEPDKVDNGESPELLDADKVVIDNENTETDTDLTDESTFPLWAIILIIAGGVLVLAAGVILVIAFARKKSKNGK